MGNHRDPNWGKTEARQPLSSELRVSQRQKPLSSKNWEQKTIKLPIRDNQRTPRALPGHPTREGHLQAHHSRAHWEVLVCHPCASRWPRPPPNFSGLGSSRKTQDKEGKQGDTASPTTKPEPPPPPAAFSQIKTLFSGTNLPAPRQAHESSRAIPKGKGSLCSQPTDTTPKERKRKTHRGERSDGAAVPALPELGTHKVCLQSSFPLHKKPRE